MNFIVFEVFNLLIYKIMKTKLFPFILLILFSLISCKKHVEIGFLMDNFKQERWAKDRDLFIERAKELGGRVILQVAEGDASKQIQQAREVLDEKIDILVVVPVDQFSAANIVGLAHKYNVKVISYDRLIRNCDLDLYISFDNIEVGRLQADYLTKVCPKGQFALIGGASNDNNSSLIKLGQMNVLQPLIERGDIGVVYDKFVDKWNQEEGYKHMLKCFDPMYCSARCSASSAWRWRRPRRDGGLHAVADEGVPVRAIAEVIGRHLNVPVVSISSEDAGAHFGFLAAFLGVDSPVWGALTRELMQWQPTHPGLVEDLEQGSYFAE